MEPHESFESAIDAPPPIQLKPRDSRKCCWVCFATEEEDLDALWVQPCKCRGTTKWVHQSCLKRWVDEKEKSGHGGKVVCPQCQTEYIIVFPNMGLFVLLLDTVDGIIFRGSLFLAAGIAASAIYWTGVTYGAITVMQVIGHKEGIDLMEQADPLVLLLGLPSIPVALILGRLVCWEDAVLKFMRRHCPKIPIIHNVLPFRGDVLQSDTTVDSDLPPVSSPVSATRILCGALLMPTIANLFGKLFYSSVKSNFHRTILGGFTFITVKGFLRIYHKQQQYIRQCQRKILDYTEANISTYLHHNRNSD
ncbi:E3 ubiquitin-protein ligase MARCHF5 [Tribolium madens]|uniref:E3 ubiquitin-protein ligase MARCHF5 n=1 Tax=Tribolium madens TaxID=41895 RepID=UPI001CF752C6|nr:E3 ubiquitin-protein ligase MARCHF5 [Tribolium madens]